MKKPSVSDSNSDTMLTGEDSMFQQSPSSDSASKKKICEEECDELDKMFKNIDLKDQSDNVPVDWLESNESPLPNAAVYLSTVYEGSESKYRSSKSVNSSTISKNSVQSELSRDSLINVIKPSETSKDSLDRSFVTCNNLLPIELNDTLEDVEYVCDEKNRYLLKPVSKTSTVSTSYSLVCSSAETSVILVDSSPETSFATAQNDIKVMDVKDIKTEIEGDKSTTLNSMKSSLAPTELSINLSFTTAHNDLKLIKTDDIKSEFDCEKTSTTSDGKINSWTTLDLSDEASSAPIVEEQNDSLFLAKNKVQRSEYDDVKLERSSGGPMFTCISYPKTTSFFELDEDKSISSDNGKSSEYYTAANQSTSVSASRLVIKFIFYKNISVILTIN